MTKSGAVDSCWLRSGPVLTHWEIVMQWYFPCTVPYTGSLSQRSWNWSSNSNAWNPWSIVYLKIHSKKERERQCSLTHLRQGKGGVERPYYPSLELDNVYVRVYAKSLQSCLIPCNPMDCSPPDSSVHGISQARILEWVVMPSSRGSSPPGDWTHISYVPCVGRWVL